METNFKIGDTVVYGVNGVCSISEKCEICFIKGEKAHEYLILTPCGDGKSKIYIPTDKEELLSRIHRIMTEDEISELLQEAKDADMPAAMDKTARNLMLDQAVQNGDRGMVLGLIRYLLKEGENQKNISKKMLFSDENLLKSAQKTILDEFSFVLNKTQSDTEDYIKTQLEI